jgi:hypothetical protein
MGQLHDDLSDIFALFLQAKHSVYQTRVRQYPNPCTRVEMIGELPTLPSFEVQ